jgi:hypothetical protein
VIKEGLASAMNRFNVRQSADTLSC